MSQKGLLQNVDASSLEKFGFKSPAESRKEKTRKVSQVQEKNDRKGKTR